MRRRPRTETRPLFADSPPPGGKKHWRWALWAALNLGGLLVGRSWAEDIPQHPRVVAAWPAGLMEVRIAFDRPIDPSAAGTAVGRLIVLDEDRPTADLEHRKPIDRKEPATEHHGTLKIAAARLDDDGRTLVLTTDPHPRVATYALGLPGVKERGAPGAGQTVNLAYDLTGVNATWDDGKDGSKPSWSGWWPGLDTETGRQVTREPARPGRLMVSTMLLLKGKGALRIEAGIPFEALLAGEEKKSTSNPDGSHELSFQQDGTGELLDLTLTLRTGTTGKPPALGARFRDQRLARGVLFVPWAPPVPPPPGPLPAVPDLAGGDRARGETIFFGDAAKCANCHTIHGKGGAVGPDLSDQFDRDRARVYRDLAEPSAVIHPNYVPYTLALKDGQVLAGTVRAEGADSLRVTGPDAKAQVIPRADVEEMRPSATSIMPVGLVGAIGEAAVRDLMAFLMSRPKKN